MKNKFGISLLLLAIALCLFAINANKRHYTDGVFTGESQSHYTSEPYWGQARVEIKDDRIISLSFQIIDKDKNEIFGPDYERHFKDNPNYAEQCRNEVKAIKVYRENYLKTKDMKQVDAITGATWSYNIFRDALNVALEKAKKKF
jgi:major membrane immunogen (membrane-anchored lipoprotein)